MGSREEHKSEESMSEDSYNSITIGRFYLETLPDDPDKVHITLNHRSGSCGEGGSFPIEKLEQAIAEFYDKEF